MARTPEGQALTEQYRLQQLGIRAVALKDLLRLWPAWNVDNPGSYDSMAAAVVLLMQARAKDSAALAARYYDLFRAVELGTLAAGAVSRAALAAPAPVEQIRTSVDATAKAGVYRALGKGYGRERALRQGFVNLSGAVGRHVLNGGRQTIENAVKQDPRCLGWARVTDGDPCPFCAMLAARGPVYKDETVQFMAHDHCGCSAEPVYENSKWPGKGREFAALYKRVKAEKEPGEDMMAAFRRAYQARAPA